MVNPNRYNSLTEGKLSERLRERLDELGVTQADLARATGTKAPSVTKWVSGQTKALRYHNLVRAAEFLKVNETWLAEGTGPKDRSFKGATMMTVSKEDFDALTDTQKAAIEEWVNEQISAYRKNKT